MSIVQRLAELVLPDSWYLKVRDSSDRWMIQCTRCKTERSVWSVGGIRFGAASVGKRMVAQCSTCEDVVLARVYFRDAESDKETWA